MAEAEAADNGAPAGMVAINQAAVSPETLVEAPIGHTARIDAVMPIVDEENRTRENETMRRTLTGLVAFLMLIVGCGVVVAQTSETIRLTNGEWQPYLSKDSQHLLLSKQVEGNEAMLDLFNEGLKRLKESGRYDQIIADALAGKYAKPK